MTMKNEAKIPQERNLLGKKSRNTTTIVCVCDQIRVYRQTSLIQVTLKGLLLSVVESNKKQPQQT